MKVLVVGSGGREHALAWKIKQSPKVRKLYCAPGNAGIAGEAECVPMAGDDVTSLVKFAKAKAVDLVVIGPEAPLTLGLTDLLEAEGILAFGCSRAAAELEGSKVFAKELMKKYHIPTAKFGIFEDPALAKDYIRDRKGQQVVKADGLAAGKGVIVCDSKGEAIRAIEQIMEQRAFGDAGKRVVIEKRMVGEEASFLAFTDGETVLPLASCQDHKAIHDDDKGPNTGGMGAYSPAPVVTRQLHDRIMKDVMVPAVKAMKAEGRLYQGVLYAGIMVTESGIEVLEFNARFGDPETQPLLFRMKSDIVDLLIACARADGSLASMKIEWYPDPAVCVVMASQGYPGHYDKGHEIHGLAEAAKLDNAYVFHAGTSVKDGKTVTSGGRVLGVTARGPDIPAAIEAAYAAVKTISWKGAYYRTDIGKKALKRCGCESK
ncbi:MAG TPA: phosphoribosylamine--glycine ligase [bacterium]|nr:phosphoribosylamine--glycine ligase [bacterium]